MRIRDLGWKKFGSVIRDKHPGFATLVRTTSVYRGDYVDTVENELLMSSAM
jgi:hypothetical protein